MTIPATLPPSTPEAQWHPKHSLQRYFWTLTALIGLSLVLIGALVAGINWSMRKHIQSALDAVPPLRLTLTARSSLELIIADVYRYVPPYGTPNTTDQHRLITVLSLHRTRLIALIEEYEAWIEAHPAHPLHRLMTEALFLMKEANETVRFLMEAASEQRWGDVRSLTHHLEILGTRLEVRVAEILRVADYQWKTALLASLRDMDYMLWIPGGVAVSVILLLVIQSLLLQRRIVRPILQLVQTLQEFAQGRMDVRLPEIRDDEIGLAVRVFNSMAEQIQQSHIRLEQEVQERTLALQRRVAQITAAADIGRLIAQEHDLDTLLQRAAQLIAERFGYYAVNIFLIDESGTWAVMRASSHPGGQRLIEQGFRMRVGEQGLVGYAAQTGRERVVGDVTQDPFYYANPEFPETRSEAVFPLRSGEKIRGVLDVQSTRLHSFQAGELETLHIVVDLLSAALTNVELLERQQRTLQELQRTQALLMAESWRYFTHTYLAPGYRLQGRQFETLPAQEYPLAPRPASHRVQIPLKVYGHTIAVLELERPAQRRWSPREREILEMLASRMAIALETARQFTLSQRRMAWMHHIVEMARRPVLRPVAVVAQDLTTYIQETFRWPHVVLFRWRPKAQQVEQVAGQERWPSPFRAAGWQESAWFRALQESQRPILENRFPWASGREGTRLVLPLVLRQELWGFLEIGFEQPYAFTSQDMPILEVLGEYLASALETARLFEQIESLLQGHQEIHDLVVQLTMAPSVDEAMIQALQGIHANSSRDIETGVALYRWDPGTNTLYLHHALPEEIVPILPKVWVDRETPLFEVMDTGWPQQLRVTPEQESLFAAGYRRLLAIPLRTGQVRLGVLLLLRSQEAPTFTKNEQQILATLGQVLSAVFYNLTLLADLNRRTRELDLLYSFLEALARHTNIQPALEEAAQRLRAAFDSLHCGIALFEQDDTGTPFSVLVATASRDTEDEQATQQWIGTRFPHEDDWSILTVKQKRQPLILPRVTEDPRLSPTIREILRQRKTGTLVILPLIVRGQVIGTVGIDYEEPEREIPPETLQLMIHMVNELSITLERLQLLEEVNRRAQREHLVREISTRLRATTEPHEVLRVLLQEVQQALGAQRVQVLIQSETAPPENERGSHHGGTPGRRA